MKALVLVLFVLTASLAHAGPETDEVQSQLRDYLLQAARSGDRTILDEFIQAGYDLETADDKGYTALILAAYHGHLDSVERLLQAGANPCAQDRRGNTALMGAIFKGEVRIARRLMAAPCNPDQRNESGQTAAMYAALFQRTELLAALRERGIDERTEDRLGNSVESLERGELNGLPQR